MMSANDPVESLFNSFQVVKEAFTPLESGLRKAAKDFVRFRPDMKGVGNTTLEVSPVQLSGGSDKNGNNVQICSVKKSDQCAHGHERKKGLSVKFPVKIFMGFFSGHKIDTSEKGLKEDAVHVDGTCSNCLQFAVTWSLLLNSFVQAFPTPSETDKMIFQKMEDEDRFHGYSCAHTSPKALIELKKKKFKGQVLATFQKGELKRKVGKNLSIECFLGFLCDQLTQNLQKIDLAIQESKGKRQDQSLYPHPTYQDNHLRAATSISKGKKAELNGFWGYLRFARLGGIPSSITEVTSLEEDSDESVTAGSKEETRANSTQNLASGLLSIPLSKVERFRSTLPTVSLTEVMELVPHLGQPSKDYPDTKKLFSVQDFFRYTESEGRRFFEELDRDGDGQVTLEDLEVAMRKRKLPCRYAHEFIRCTRRHLFSKSFGWKQFASLMEQKEPTILRAYTSLCLSEFGTLQKSDILASLKSAGLPANEETAVTMMKFLNADTEEYISYGHFRNFMLLLPSDQLKEDPRSVWFEAANDANDALPVELPASSVLKSALAGGLSCAFSCAVMHPVDTVKTRVQASTTHTFPEIMSKLPQIGVRGLYKGSIPAILGQFSSHGLRTGLSEVFRVVLLSIAPTLPEIQVQSVASFSGTFLGTAMRIPCEVLKQRLQAGMFKNVGEAIVGTWNQDGLNGFFRGTGVTLFREVPFYVAGTGLYAESKKVAQHLLGRDLGPWETIVVGALSGGLTAVSTTPFDVIKTRMMTASGGQSLSMSMAAFSILRYEGPLGLFKGAVPRFFWVAPLGAMNFAGYELLRKAMDGNGKQTPEQLSR